MKKSFYIILSFLTAFLINELFVKYIIGYPSLGLEKELYGIRSSQGGWQKIYFPYSKYWNVEGGNITETYNNWGLPGEDIIIKDTSKVIFLLGDSFMECIQMKKNDMASSVFQRMLQNDDVRYSVINLFASGHDVYDLYLRKSYYSKIVKPEYIMIVLHSANTNWLLRHHKIDFVLNPDVGKEKKSFIFLLQKCARNSLSSVNLYVQSFKNADPSLKRTGDLNLEYNENINTPLPDNSLLDKVLLKYSEEYGGRFILLSVTPDKNLNSHLFELHQKTGIKYFQKDISIPQNRINVIGHLTKEGNIKLAQFLYESFETAFKNE